MKKIVIYHGIFWTLNEKNNGIYFCLIFSHQNKFKQFRSSPITEISFHNDICCIKTENSILSVLNPDPKYLSLIEQYLNNNLSMEDILKNPLWDGIAFEGGYILS